MVALRCCLCAEPVDRFDATVQLNVGPAGLRAWHVACLWALDQVQLAGAFGG
jgi:hypothetical protein